METDLIAEYARAGRPFVVRQPQNTKFRGNS